jgi:hypothetical protein
VNRSIDRDVGKVVRWNVLYDRILGCFGFIGALEWHAGCSIGAIRPRLASFSVGCI